MFAHDSILQLATADLSLADWLTVKLESMGVDHHVHRFCCTSCITTTNSSSSSSSRDRTGGRAGSCCGTNVVAVVRARHGRGDEAIVLLTPLSSPSSSPSSASSSPSSPSSSQPTAAEEATPGSLVSVGVALSLLRLLQQRALWLGRDVLWVVAGAAPAGCAAAAAGRRGVVGAELAVRAWLRDYYSQGRVGGMGLGGDAQRRGREGWMEHALGDADGVGIGGDDSHPDGCDGAATTYAGLDAGSEAFGGWVEGVDGGEEGFVRAGMLLAAVGFSVGDGWRWGDGNPQNFRVRANGLNGHMPNLDLPALVHSLAGSLRLSAQLATFGDKGHGDDDTDRVLGKQGGGGGEEEQSDGGEWWSRWGRMLGQKQDHRSKTTSAPLLRLSQWRVVQGAAWAVDGLRAMGKWVGVPLDGTVADGETFLRRVEVLAQQLVWQLEGSSPGAHGPFRSYQVDAVSIEAAVHSDAQSAAAHRKRTRSQPVHPTIPPQGLPSSYSLEQIGRLLEATIRCLSNLSERLHHSHFFYLLCSLDAFLPISRYIIPFALLLVPFALRAANASSQFSAAAASAAAASATASAEMKQESSAHRDQATDSSSGASATAAGLGEADVASPMGAVGRSTAMPVTAAVWVAAASLLLLLHAWGFVVAALPTAVSRLAMLLADNSVTTAAFIVPTVDAWRAAGSAQAFLMLWLLLSCGSLAGVVWWWVAVGRVHVRRMATILVTHASPPTLLLLLVDTTSQLILCSSSSGGGGGGRGSVGSGGGGRDNCLDGTDVGSSPLTSMAAVAHSTSENAHFEPKQSEAAGEGGATAPARLQVGSTGPADVYQDVYKTLERAALEALCAGAAGVEVAALCAVNFGVALAVALVLAPLLWAVQPSGNLQPTHKSSALHVGESPQSSVRTMKGRSGQSHRRGGAVLRLLSAMMCVSGCAFFAVVTRMQLFHATVLWNWASNTFTSSGSTGFFATTLVLFPCLVCFLLLCSKL